jgi:3-deoxy-manno-octulosonate cytidylyltransferase (CMP-KDO synthetase)
MDVSIIIPARYNSTRFPGKPLAKINGKEMILHTADGCAPAFGKDNVCVVTDDSRISDVVTKAGYRVIMTRKDQVFRTGSDRVAYAAKALDSNFIIDVQGDEPLVDTADIQNVYSALKHNMACSVNCYSDCNPKEKDNSNTIKVIINSHESKESTLLYMSRAPIQPKYSTCIKQVCIYGWYSYAFQDMFGEGKERAFLESGEDIHILRVLDHGRNVLMVPVLGEYQAVDVPSDIKKVEDILNARKKD